MFFPFPGIALLLPVLKNLWISGFRRRATQTPLSIRANAVQPSSPSLFSWVVVRTLGPDKLITAYPEANQNECTASTPFLS